MQKAPQTHVCGAFGGDKEDRTPDLMTASHALSQLSYAPKGLPHHSEQMILYQNIPELSTAFFDLSELFFSPCNLPAL